MVQYRGVLQIVVLCLIWLANPVLGADRVALLIGNSNYGHPNFSLKNPVNDINALGTALEQLGFVVRRAEDADRKAMQAAVTGFARDAKGADIALFFFAGHGVQAGGTNYLVGAGIDRLEPEHVAEESLDFARVRAALAKAKPNLGLMILDACRDNPLAAIGAFPDGLGTPKGGLGLLIAYATDPGNIAADGTGDNSLFTTSLLQHIATPGLDVRLMFGRVRQDVILASGGRQIPWVEEAVIGEHRFAPALPGAVAETDEIALWRSASLTEAASGYRAYLDQFPDGAFADLAERAIERIRDGSGTELTLAALDHGDSLAVARALEVLGHLPPSPETPAEAALNAALSAFADSLPPDATPSAERLFQDAADRAVFLAAAAQTRIRTGHGIRAAMERNLANATDLLERLRTIAADNNEARPMVAAAEADIAAMHATLDQTQRGLDNAQDYYNSLIRSSMTAFPNYVATTALSAAATRGLSDISSDLDDAATRFAAHVAEGQRHPPGSYFWLAELLNN